MAPAFDVLPSCIAPVFLRPSRRGVRGTKRTSPAQLPGSCANKNACVSRICDTKMRFSSFAFSIALMGSALAAPALLVAPAPVAAQDSVAQIAYEERIAAIVNDEVISGFDVEQRLRLLVASSGVQPTADDLRRLRSQVVRTLIDEKLQAQEARFYEVDVGEDEILEQLELIARRSGASVNDIQSQLEQDGISIYTLTDQIKTDIAWNKLVRGRFGPQVRVSEEEIDRILDDLRANYDKPQYQVVEIFLPVDNPQERDRVKEEAERLVQEIGKGVPFGQLAQEFSQAPSAANGGDIGWVVQGELPEELDGWLRGSRRGSLTAKPIPTLGGYYLLGVRDTRNVASQPTSPDTELFLRKVEVRLPNDISAESIERAKRAQRELERLAPRISGCNTLEEVIKSVRGARIVNMGTQTLRNLPQQDQQRIVQLVSGEASPLVWRSERGMDILVLCGHAEEQAQGLPSRDDIGNRLFSQQVSMMSRRYLRDLRRDAVIENRLGGDAPLGQ